jgi:hypothetical protein
MAEFNASAGYSKEGLFFDTDNLLPVMLGYNSYMAANIFKGQVMVSIQIYQIPCCGINPSRSGIQLTAEEWENFLNVADAIQGILAIRDGPALDTSYKISEDLTVRLERPEEKVYLSKVVFVKNNTSFPIGVKQLQNILAMAYNIDKRIIQLTDSLKSWNKKSSAKRVKRARVEEDDEDSE